jgi:hypothetical protein
MLIAFTAGQAVCAAWDHDAEDFDPAVSASADALRAISMLLLVPTVCPEDFFQEAPQVPDCSAAHSKKAKVRLAVRANTSLASWQFACTHESELPAAQQQALQELGCSGRVFMYVAGHALTPVMNSSTVLHLCQALLCVAKHSASSTKASRERLDSFSRRQQLVLAGALSSANNDTPPSDSPMLPCAPLFWLLPTVLLQWADKQPASGPDFTLQHYVLMSLLQVAVTGVLEQQSYWTAAEAAMFEGAGGAEEAFEQQQAMARALYAVAHGGASMGVFEVPASMQGMSPQEAKKTNQERRLYQHAGKTAASFSSDCAPPASCLAQLLRLASSAAARMLASMQDATASSSMSLSGSSSSGPSSSSAGSSNATRSGSTGRQYGGLSSHPKPNSFLSDAEHIDRALFNLAQTLPALLRSSEGWLWRVFFKDTSAARHDPLEGLRAMGIILGPQPGRSSSPWGKDGDSDGDSSSSADEQEGMAAMCAALQDTVPQLTEAVEAALRRGAGREAYGHLAAVGTSFLRNLTRDPVFVAAGLAGPSSSVLRPLSSLSFTLLKLVNAIHTETDAYHRELSIASGVSCLETVLQANSLILHAACASSSTNGSSSASCRSGSSSSSSAAAVIKMLVRSRGRGQGSLSEGHLVAISNSTSNPGSPNTSSSSSSIASAVSMVPWLVSLGRCCLGYSMVLQGLYAKAAGRAAGRRNLGDRADMRRAFQEVSMVLPGWLQSSSVSAQLAAAGYVTDPILELLQSAATA